MRKNLLWISILISLILSLLSVNMIGITVAQPVHDIAVTSVTPSQTSVRLGELINITVVVENQGTENETFDVTVYHDNTTIETKTSVFLANGTSTSLTFPWNTTVVREEVYAATYNKLLIKEKTYTINATASTVPDETDTDDNTLVSPGTVKVIAHYIAVIPQSTVDPTLTPGKNYTISIYTDYNGSDVWGWEFSLSYNPNVLEGIEVVNGDLITEAKDPSANFTAGTFDDEAGTLSLTRNFFFFIPPVPAPTTSGPGTLANVTFRVKGEGDSNIILVEREGGQAITRLINPKRGLEGVIINEFSPNVGHILHGFFQNKEVIHDVAVTSVTPSPTSVIQGEFVNITVVAKNNGTVAETFDVEVWYDYDPQGTLLVKRIGTQTVTNLENGTSTSLIFTWNTTGVPAGDREITAVVKELQLETNTANNIRDSEQTVTVTVLPGTPIPIELISGVVVVVVIAVVVYAVRRRKKPTPE